MSEYTSPSTYFSAYDKVQGVNADIARHIEEEKHLRKRIEEIEEGQRKQAYQHILRHLLRSKAQVANQLGK